MDKVRSWIPWAIAALSVSITLYFSAVGYGETKRTAADTAYFFKEHCKDQKIKEEKTDAIMNNLDKRLEVSNTQNVMILEAVTALRKDMKDAETRIWMRDK